MTLPILKRTVRVHQAQGGRPGLERDPLPRQDVHADGQAQEELLREGRGPSQLAQVRLDMTRGTGSIPGKGGMQFVPRFRLLAGRKKRLGLSLPVA